MATVLTEPEATLLCHTEIWQSVASLLFLLHCPPSVSADRHLSKTRGQPRHRARRPSSTVWQRECNSEWLMRWMGVYTGQTFCSSVLFFSVWVLALCPASVPFIYIRKVLLYLFKDVPKTHTEVLQILRRIKLSESFMSKIQDLIKLCSMSFNVCTCSYSHVFIHKFKSYLFVCFI